MRILKQLIVCLSFYIAINPAIASEDETAIIPSFKATYIAGMAGIEVGEATVSYEYDAKTGRYHYQREAHPTGLAALFVSTRISETSIGSIAGHHAIPDEYRYQRNNKPGKNRRIIFDYTTDKVKITDSQSKQGITSSPGTMDSLVMTLNMMFDLNAGREDLSYTFAKRGKIKTYPFTRGQDEQITAAATHYQTIRIRRIRENTKRSTTLWCAPELYYLPVKIEERSEDGSIERFLLKEISFTNPD